MGETAIGRGIREIGLSEHFDLHPREHKPGFYQPEIWWAEIENARKLLGDRITLRAGVEIGEPHRFPDEIRLLLKCIPYDYAIGSLHYVGDDYMFDPGLFKRKTADEILTEYFIELERMTAQPEFDILGHLDVPVRNAKHLWGGFDPRRYESLIRPVLQHCIDHGLALDVNTAGLRQPALNLMPDPLVLRWYAEMGGERVTLGSDAHRSEDVGRHLDLAMDAIRAAGLKYVTQFVRRQANLLPLGR